MRTSGRRGWDFSLAAEDWRCARDALSSARSASETGMPSAGIFLIAGCCARSAIAARARLHFPIFIEESCGYDLAGVAGVRRSSCIDDGPVGEFGRLPRVVEVVEFAEGETAVEHDVLLRVFGIRVDHDERL